MTFELTDTVEFAAALAAFQDAAARLSRAWENVDAGVLGDTYDLPHSFDEHAAGIAGWEIRETSPR